MMIDGWLLMETVEDVMMNHDTILIPNSSASRGVCLFNYKHLALTACYFRQVPLRRLSHHDQTE